MRNRILIVVLGLSLGFGARIGYDLYLSWQKPHSQPKGAGDSPPASGDALPRTQ